MGKGNGVSPLVWKVRRLMAMTPLEVVYRAYQVVDQRKRSARVKRGRITVDDPRFEPDWSAVGSGALARGQSSGSKLGSQFGSPLQYLKERVAPRFYFDPTTLSIDDLDPSAIRPAEAASAADKLCEGLVPLLGLGEYRMPADQPWTTDPRTGETWPAKFGPSIDYRRSQGKEIRLIWELNRHHHLVVIAEGYFLTGNDKYREAWVRQFDSWVCENPVDVGVNWVSPMENATRIHSWIWSLMFLIRQPGGSLTDDLVQRVLRAIHQHANHVARYRARFSSANNHLLVEVGTLAVAAMLFPEWRFCRRWGGFALRTFEREILRQVYPDGVNAEQAVHYHLFVLEIALLVLALARRNNLAVSEQVRERVRGMAAFVAAMMDRSGHLPAIGDSDDGRILPFARSEEREYRRLLAVAGELFGDRSLIDAACGFDEYSLWVLGGRVGGDAERGRGSEAGAGARDPDAAGDPSEPGSPGDMLFPHGGYAVMRGKDPESVGVLDAGPLGFGKLAAHAHADALSFTLSVEGRPVLVDPGTYIYNVEPEWRDYFRSTEVHNTVTLNGRNQSEMLGPFLWGERAQAEIELFRSSDWYSVVQARHDGYKPVIHRRRIIFLKPNVWILLDELSAESNERRKVDFNIDVAVNFQFAPELRVERVAGAAPVAAPAVKLEGGFSVPLWLATLGDAPFTIEDAWVSRSFANRERAPRARIRSSASVPFRVPIVISLAPVQPVVTQLAASCWEISLPAPHPSQVAIAIGPCRCEELAFDGEWIVAVSRGDVASGDGAPKDGTAEGGVAEEGAHDVSWLGQRVKSFRWKGQSVDVGNSRPDREGFASHPGTSHKV